MGNNAYYACSGGCGTVSTSGSAAMFSVLVQNGSTISSSNNSNILLAAGRTYSIEYNLEFTTLNPSIILSSQLMLNGAVIPGSLAASFPTTNRLGQVGYSAGLSAGIILNTPNSPAMSTVQILGIAPSNSLSPNFSNVSVRINDITLGGEGSYTSNNASFVFYGYDNVASNQPVPFAEMELQNGTGITFNPSLPTRMNVHLAPNRIYFASYNIIQCPLQSETPVFVGLSLNGSVLEQSYAVSSPITDGTSRSGSAGSAVINTGLGNNILQLLNLSTFTVKFAAANLNIVQIGEIM